MGQLATPPPGASKAATVNCVHAKAFLLAVACAVGLLLAGSLPAPLQAAQAAPALPDPARLTELVREIANQQADYLERKGSHFRYHLHRVDPREDTLRDVIESTGGNVTRLLQHNGQALTPAENDGDRERLAQYLESGDLRKKEREEARAHVFGLELMRAMPAAMLYTLTPGQPQLPQHDRAQIVMDFSPNPQFHPATTAEGLLSGISGRLWIDAADHHLLRMELTVLHNLDLAFGLLARVYAGGTVEYDQQRIGEGAYAFAHIRMHLRLRELMLRTVPYNSDLVATDIELLSPPPTPEKAVQVLLQDEVKTR